MTNKPGKPVFTSTRAIALRILLPALVFAVTVVLYWPAMNVGFIADDPGYFPFFRMTWSEMAKGIAGIRMGLLEFYPFRPVVILSFRLDYLIWGVDPTGFHLTNIILHAANALMLFYLAGILGLKKIPALFAALFFGLYPASPEAVTWISGRFDVMSMTWLMAALILWCKFRLKGGIGLLVGSTAAFFLAVFSKESTVAIILVLPLIDWILSLQTSGDPDRKKIPKWPGYIAYIGVILFAIGFRYWLYRDLGGYSDPYDGSSNFNLELSTIWENLIIRDLWMLFTPINRLVLEDWTYGWYSLLLLVGFIGGIALFLSLFAALAGRKGENSFAWPVIVLGFFWILALLLPVGPIAGVEESLDFSRFLYVPAAGLALWVGAAAGIGVSRFPSYRYFWTVVLMVLVLGVSNRALQIHNRVWNISSENADRIHALVAAHAEDLPDDSTIFLVNVPWRWEGVHFRPVSMGSYIRFLYGSENVTVHFVGKPPEWVGDWWEKTRMQWRHPGIAFEWDEETKRLKYLGETEYQR